MRAWMLYIFLILVSEGRAMAQWPRPPYASAVIFNRCSVKDRQVFRRKFDKFD